MGRAGGIEERLAQRSGIPFRAINVAGVRGQSPVTAVLNLIGLARSTGSVRAIIRTFKPDVTFVTGGYVSAPVIWASAAERVPSVIYLPDLEPGWSVRTTAHWATRVAVSFPEVVTHFSKGKAVVTGYPVRGEFFQVDRIQARRAFQLGPDARTVTVFGGSRGAHHINQAAVDNLADLSRLAQLVLVTGLEDEEWVNSEVKKLPQELCRRVRVYGYLDEQLPEALAAADIIVARAGAATLGEFPALGRPAILVPYPFAGRHQERNASFLVERGAAIKIDDARLGGEIVPTLGRLLGAPDELSRMSEASRSMAQPRAAAQMVSLLRSLAGTQA